MHTLAPVHSERGILFDLTGIGTKNTTRADIKLCRISIGIWQRVQLHAISVAGNEFLSTPGFVTWGARFSLLDEASRRAYSFSGNDRK